MRNKVAVILVIAGLILCLSGCRPSGQKKSADESALEKAKTVYDVSYLMTRTEDSPIYSECDNDKDLYFYFDLLSSEEYIKVNHKGNDYLLISYTYYSYIDFVTEIENVEKSYEGSQLKVQINFKKESFDSGTNGGCFPTGSTIRLILSLDSDVDLIYMSGHPVKKFNGCQVKICNKVGVVDKDLNFILPPIYDGIIDLETTEKSDCPKYYRYFTRAGGNGVLDNNYNRVLSDVYGNIYYINENKFIVGIPNDDHALEEIAIVDRNENIIKKIPGFLCARDGINLYAAEGQIQICDPSYGSNWGYGIVDQDLNIIIEPVYAKVYWYETYYRVEDYTGKSFKFDIEGKKI